MRAMRTEQLVGDHDRADHDGECGEYGAHPCATGRGELGLAPVDIDPKVRKLRRRKRCEPLTMAVVSLALG